MKNLRIIISFFLCSIFYYTHAQTFFSIQNNRNKTTIPFKLYRNIIVIPVTVNGQGPFNFILDTGSGICTITDPSLLTKLNLQPDREINISGSGELKPTKAYLTNNIVIAAKNVKSIPLTIPVFESDPFFLSEYLGVDVHGILGFEFFNSFILKINYAAQTITLYNPGKFKAGSRYDSLDISVRNKKPYIKGVCGFDTSQLITVDLLIDTGAGFPLSLETYSNEKITLPQKNLKALIGVGLSGLINGHIARTPLLKLGNYSFGNIVTGFPDYKDSGSKQTAEKRNGSIGNFLLNRFIVVFDYAHEKLFLKPNARLKSVFPYDRTGIDVVAAEKDYRRYIVQSVKINSPAYYLGVLPGDELQQINFKNANTYTLTQIDHLLSDPEATSITIRLKRDDQIIYVIIEMEDLI